MTKLIQLKQFATSGLSNKIIKKSQVQKRKLVVKPKKTEQKQETQELVKYKSNTTINNISVHLISKVMEYLDTQSLHEVNQTCKVFYILSDNAWKQLTRDFETFYDPSLYKNYHDFYCQLNKPSVPINFGLDVKQNGWELEQQLNKNYGSTLSFPELKIESGVWQFQMQIKQRSQAMAIGFINEEDVEDYTYYNREAEQKGFHGYQFDGSKPYLTSDEENSSVTLSDTDSWDTDHYVGVIFDMDNKNLKVVHNGNVIKEQNGIQADRIIPAIWLQKNEDQVFAFRPQRIEESYLGQLSNIQTEKTNNEMLAF